MDLIIRMKPCSSIYESRNLVTVVQVMIWAKSLPEPIWLPWRHNEHVGVSNHQPHDYLLKRLSRRRSKKTPKLRVTGLCEGNSPGTGEFPSQMARNAENVYICWRHHAEPLEVISVTFYSKRIISCKFFYLKLPLPSCRPFYGHINVLIFYM